MDLEALRAAALKSKKKPVPAARPAAGSRTRTAESSAVSKPTSTDAAPKANGTPHAGSKTSESSALSRSSSSSASKENVGTALPSGSTNLSDLQPTPAAKADEKEEGELSEAESSEVRRLSAPTPKAPRQRAHPGRPPASRPRPARTKESNPQPPAGESNSAVHSRPSPSVPLPSLPALSLPPPPAQPPPMPPPPPPPQLQAVPTVSGFFAGPSPDQPLATIDPFGQPTYFSYSTGPVIQSDINRLRMLPNGDSVIYVGSLPKGSQFATVMENLDLAYRLGQGLQAAAYSKISVEALSFLGLVPEIILAFLQQYGQPPVAFAPSLLPSGIEPVMHPGSVFPHPYAVPVQHTSELHPPQVQPVYPPLPHPHQESKDPSGSSSSAGVVTSSFVSNDTQEGKPSPQPHPSALASLPYRPNTFGTSNQSPDGGQSAPSVSIQQDVLQSLGLNLARAPAASQLTSSTTKSANASDSEADMDIDSDSDGVAPKLAASNATHGHAPVIQSRDGREVALPTSQTAPALPAPSISMQPQPNDTAGQNSSIVPIPKDPLVSVPDTGHRGAFKPFSKFRRPLAADMNRPVSFHGQFGGNPKWVNNGYGLRSQLSDGHADLLHDGNDKDCVIHLDSSDEESDESQEPMTTTDPKISQQKLEAELEMLQNLLKQKMEQKRAKLLGAASAKQADPAIDARAQTVSTPGTAASTPPHLDVPEQVVVHRESYDSPDNTASRETPSPGSLSRVVSPNPVPKIASIVVQRLPSEGKGSDAVPSVPSSEGEQPKNQLEQTISDAEKHIAERNRDIAKSESDVRQLKAELIQTNSKLADAEARIERTKAELERIKLELWQAKLDKEKLEVSSKEITTKIDDHKKAMAVSVGEITVYHQKIKACNAKLMSLKVRELETHVRQLSSLKRPGGEGSSPLTSGTSTPRTVSQPKRPKVGETTAAKRTQPVQLQSGQPQPSQPKSPRIRPSHPQEPQPPQTGPGANEYMKLPVFDEFLKTGSRKAMARVQLGNMGDSDARTRTWTDSKAQDFASIQWPGDDSADAARLPLLSINIVERQAADGQFMLSQHFLDLKDILKPSDLLDHTSSQSWELNGRWNSTAFVDPPVPVLQNSSPSIEQSPDPPTKSGFRPYESALSQFRSFRMNPLYKSVVKGGVSSLTFSNRLNPLERLCRFEAVGGQCNDDACTSQHFKDLGMSDDDLLVDLLSYVGESNQPQTTDALRKKLLQSRVERRPLEGFVDVLTSHAQLSGTLADGITPLSQHKREQHIGSGGPDAGIRNEPDAPPIDFSPPFTPHVYVKGLANLLNGEGIKPSRYFEGFAHVEEYEAHVAKEPHNIVLWINYAAACLPADLSYESLSKPSRNLNKSLGVLSKALTNNRTSPHLWHFYLELYTRRGKDVDIRSVMEKAIKFAPSHLELFWRFYRWEPDAEARLALLNRMLSQWLANENGALDPQAQSHAIINAAVARARWYLDQDKQEAAADSLQHFLTLRNGPALFDPATSLPKLEGSVLAGTLAYQKLDHLDYVIIWLVYIRLLYHGRIDRDFLHAYPYGHIVKRTQPVFDWNATLTRSQSQKIMHAFSLILNLLISRSEAVPSSIPLLALVIRNIRRFRAIHPSASRSDPSSRLPEALKTHPDIWIVLYDSGSLQGQRQHRATSRVKPQFLSEPASVPSLMWNCQAQAMLQRGLKTELVCCLVNCIRSLYAGCALVAPSDLDAHDLPEVADNAIELYRHALSLEISTLGFPEFAPGVDRLRLKHDVVLWMNFLLLMTIRLRPDEPRREIPLAYEFAVEHIKAVDSRLLLWTEYIAFASKSPEKGTASSHSDYLTDWKATVAILGRAMADTKIEARGQPDQAGPHTDHDFQALVPIKDIAKPCHLLQFCLDSLGSLDERQADLIEAVRQKYPDMVRCSLVARTLFQSKRYKAGRLALHECLRLNPHNPDIWKTGYSVERLGGRYGNPKTAEQILAASRKFLPSCASLFDPQAQASKVDSTPASQPTG
ncbi:uncharacterized protein BJ171DRAFT_51042 [Polychytrium aggregatum]|uniref:uncharacterized protein n=1 Tax=Polychytrium aggregatum TaxID=110093 RepID=UPI0022FEAF02|nr:uncharacterized protein BJ171DRAFT_51042 [Polychytrium aggregatum]KAI9205722.1 hypothetical protein BJ171DRAFT_51042 [Polychytrium aggregatum]